MAAVAVTKRPRVAAPVSTSTCRRDSLHLAPACQSFDRLSPRAMTLSERGPVGLAKFKPLSHLLCYDEFNQGLNGWIDLRPNHTEPGFRALRGVYDKNKSAPLCLSTASFGWAGTHGAL